MYLNYTDIDCPLLTGEALLIGAQNRLTVTPDYPKRQLKGDSGKQQYLLLLTIGDFRNEPDNSGRILMKAA